MSNFCILTLFILDTGKQVPNSEDQDEMPHQAAFHQGLYCLLGENYFQGQKNIVIDKFPPITPSDFIWPFLRPYMGVIPNPKMTFIFPISCILAHIFLILIKYFPKCEGKGSFLKSQIKSLTP